MIIINLYLRKSVLYSKYKTMSDNKLAIYNDPKYQICGRNVEVSRYFQNVKFFSQFPKFLFFIQNFHFINFHQNLQLINALEMCLLRCNQIYHLHIYRTRSNPYAQLVECFSDNRTCRSLLHFACTPLSPSSILRSIYCRSCKSGQLEFLDPLYL